MAWNSRRRPVDGSASVVVAVILPFAVALEVSVIVSVVVEVRGFLALAKQWVVGSRDPRRL